MKAVAPSIHPCPRGLRLEDAVNVTGGIGAARAHDGTVPVNAVVTRTGLALLPRVALEMANAYPLFAPKGLIGDRVDERVNRTSPNLRHLRERSMDAAVPGTSSRRLQRGHRTSTISRRG